MKTVNWNRVGVVVAALLISFSASAIESVSLDELLQKVQSGRVKDAKENQDRIQSFKRDKANQAKRLSDMKAARKREEARSQRLEDTFEVNERSTIALEKTLHDRLGSLKELFGVLQQGAGDARGQFENSLTQPQFTERTDFLTALAQKMGQTSKLASLEEIEQLWYELQREMTESGRVAKFRATVINSDGDEEEKMVTRVGVFNAIADGKYLEFIPETGRLVELKRQPQGRFLNRVEDLEAAGSGFTAFGVDPSRGQILSLLVQAPSLRERIDQGGVVGYIIISVGAVALLVAVIRLVTLTLVGGRVRRQMKNPDKPGNNALGRVLKVYHANKAVDVETMELRLGEAILKETPKFNAALMFMKIIAVIAPLMGLLGTVTGMIVTFQMITLFGTGDPKLMAGGISTALVTTVLGLCVAIPTVLMHTMMASRAKRLTQILQEQTVGMIAEQAEAQRAGEGL